MFYELTVLKYIQKEHGRIHKAFSRGTENLHESVQHIMNYKAVNLMNLPKLKFSDFVELRYLDKFVRYETLLNILGEIKI